MKKYDISIIAAGLLWGMMGVFTRILSSAGVSSEGVSVIRSAGCTILFFVAALITDPKLLKFRLRDLWLFVCFGVLATFFFTYCYYRSILLGSMSAACTLMYSAPVFVMVISLFVFHEKFTRRKLAALVCAFTGCCLVSGVLEGGAGLNAGAVVFGLLAGIGYAFYSVCIKALSNRGYSTLCINAWGWLFCTATALLVFGADTALPAMESTRGILAGVGIIVISGFLPAHLYSLGLRGEEAGKGAVMASIEPVTASVLGFLFYGETPTPLGILGIALVLGAVVLLNTGKTKE